MIYKRITTKPLAIILLTALLGLNSCKKESNEIKTFLHLKVTQRMIGKLFRTNILLFIKKKHSDYRNRKLQKVLLS
jgi:hypothetical protein